MARADASSFDDDDGGPGRKLRGSTPIKSTDSGERCSIRQTAGEGPGRGERPRNKLFNIFDMVEKKPLAIIAFGGLSVRRTCSGGRR